MNVALTSARWNNRSDAVVQILARNSSRTSVLLDVFADCFSQTVPCEQSLGGPIPWDGSSLLAASMTRNGWSLVEKDYVNAGLTTDRFRILAARLQDALVRWFPDKNAVWSTLTGLYADERAMVAQVYRSNYGHSLLQEINENLNPQYRPEWIFGQDFQKTLKIFRSGGLSLAERVFYATQGLRADSAELRRVVSELGGCRRHKFSRRIWSTARWFRRSRSRFKPRTAPLTTNALPSCAMRWLPRCRAAIGSMPNRPWTVRRRRCAGKCNACSSFAIASAIEIYWSNETTGNYFMWACIEAERKVEVAASEGSMKFIKVIS